MAGFNDEEEIYPFVKDNKVWHTLDRRQLQQLADNYSNLVAEYMDQRHSPEKIYDIAEKNGNDLMNPSIILIVTISHRRSMLMMYCR